jgi:tetratricopeptide (TPR) repeat protein
MGCRDRHTRSWRIAICAAVMLATGVPAHGSPASRQRAREAFAHAYRLNFAAAYSAFNEAAALDATDPGPPRGIAAVAWIETLFGQGVVTFEAFTGQVSKSDVARPPVSPALTQKFRTHLARALDLAQQRVRASDDADAHYELGATEALAALYMATVEGRTLGSLGAGRRAVRALERSRALNPGRREPALVLGMSRYTVSTMPAPVRLVARMAGLSGGRAEGISLLEEAASPDADTEADALLILMIVHNREGRHAEAIGRLATLRSRYPTNRLLTLNEGATALEAGQFQRAETLLAAGLEVHDVRAAPAVLGEEALWRLKLGTARAALKRSDEAQRDLCAVIALHGREWVQARAHAELGTLARSRSDEANARRHFARALELAQRSGDGGTARQVESLLKASPW